MQRRRRRRRRRKRRRRGDKKEEEKEGEETPQTVCRDQQSPDPSSHECWGAGPPNCMDIYRDIKWWP